MTLKPTGFNESELEKSSEVKLPVLVRGQTEDHVNTTISGHPALWTTGMADCSCITTYDSKAKGTATQRTLFHANGSNPPDKYYENLVKLINDKTPTIVVISNGAYALVPERFLLTEFGGVPANMKEKLLAEMKIVEKSTANLSFQTFFPREVDDKKNGLMGGTFVIDGHGSWGRIKAEKARPSSDKGGTSSEKGGKSGRSSDKGGKADSGEEDGWGG
jgi:hypothetical protein